MSCSKCRTHCTQLTFQGRSNSLHHTPIARSPQCSWALGSTALPELHWLVGAGPACTSALLEPAPCWQEKPEPALPTQGTGGE